MPTLQEVFDWYQRNGPRDRCPKASRERLRICRLFCRFAGASGRRQAFGRRPYDVFKPYHLLEFLNRYLRDAAGYTRRRWAATVQAPMNEATRQGFIDRNPFWGLRLPMGKNGRDWTEEEYQAVLHFAPAHVRRILLFIRFSGARPGEAREARWQDLDWEANAIVLRQHKTVRKCPEARRIRLNYVTVKLLLWLLRNPRPDADPQVIFANWFGRAFTIKALTKLFLEARRKAGLPGEVKIHGLRHTFATHGLTDGVDLATMAALLGHRTVMTTQRYVHLVDKSDHLDQAAHRAIGGKGAAMRLANGAAKQPITPRGRPRRSRRARS